MLVIIVVLVIAGFSSVYGIATDSDSMDTVAQRFFSARNVHAIDALLCSPEDGRKIFRHFLISPRIALPSLLRIVKNFSLENTDIEMRAGIFIDVTCIKNQKLLLRLADDRLFINNFCWLVWDSEGLPIDSYAGLPVSTFSDVSVFSHRRLIKLFKHREGTPLISQDVGFWNDETNVFSITPWDMRINYHQAVVSGAILFIDDIYDRSLLQQQLQDDQFKPGKDGSNRFIFGNTMHLAYLFNFTLNLTETHTWGDRSSNGTWNGLIGLLQTKEADLTISPLLPISQRLEVSYPAVPTLPYWMAIIVKQPRALGTYRAMILELSLSTWGCVAIMIILGAIAFTLTQRYGQNDDTIHESDGSLAVGLVQSVGIISNQGLTLIPKSYSARIVCLTLLVVGLLVTDHYNAATMTALLSPSPPFIKSLEQLMSSRTPLSAMNAPYVCHKKSRTRVFRPIVVERMEKEMRICDAVEGIGTLLNGSAFLGEYFTVFTAISENLQSDVICDLTIFNAGFHRNAASFTKKCPHFRELYMRGMLRTFEHGLMIKERQRWIAGQPVCARKTEFIHVRLEAVSIAAAVSLIGVVVSISLFVVEMLVARQKRESSRKKQSDPQENDQ